MKLAALGAITLIIGIALAIEGLIAAGGLWIVTGPLARAYGQAWERRGKEVRAAAIARGDAGPPSTAGGKRATPAVGGWWVARGTLLWLLIGLPSLAIGVFEIGVEPDESAWRWLPIAIGGLTTGVGVVSGLLYALGSGIEATGKAMSGGGAGDVPATITIRSARETGTYINERPRLELELTVEPDGMPAYEVTKKATVPHTALGSIRPGDGFRAMVVGPQKPESMEIDWSSPIPGPDGRGADADASDRLEELEELERKGLVTGDEYADQRRRILDSL